MNLKIKNFSSAIEDLSAVLNVADLSPEFQFRAYYTRGKARDFSNLHDPAIADFTAALRLRPGTVDVIVDRAKSYIKAGQSDQAIDSLDPVIAATDASPDSRFLAIHTRGKAYEAKELTRA